MAKTLYLRFLIISTLLLTFSSDVFSSSPLHTDPTIPIAKKDGAIRAAEIIKLTSADYARMTGKKMTLRQKMGFVLLKVKLRKEVKKNPSLLLSDFNKDKKMATGWLVLLIVLSVLLLALLVVAILYGRGA